VNNQEFNASSWRSKQGYTKMDGQPTIKNKWCVRLSNSYCLVSCINTRNSCFIYYSVFSKTIHNSVSWIS